jgi:hypothetical protein
MNVLARVIVSKPHVARGDKRFSAEVQLLAGNLRPYCGESQLHSSCVNRPYT